MDSWKNIILHWINCLQDDKNKHIKNLIELDDDTIFDTLIEKIKFSNKKDNKNDRRQIIYQFMKDEYPNVIFSDTKSNIDNLYMTILILSRLSLEPVFHKSLCTNLPMDLQVKIKSILESIYKLGKKITTYDLCKILEISDNTDIISCNRKPNYLLENFLKSPIIRSVYTDNKIHEHNREVRTLRAKIETLYYEKSELVEDIKIQQNQIQELQIKLYNSLSNLKNLPDNNLEINNLNYSYKTKNMQLIDSAYKKELQSIEDYVTELQNNNLQFQNEKNDFLYENKKYKTKISMLNERNVKNNQMLELILLRTEKNEEELLELKIKYEELYNYLKDKYKVCFYNESFDLDDKEICDVSFNKSETLSSVIEIQLLDTKKDLIIVQNKFKSINILLTIFMEEYKKLKEKYYILYTNNIKINEEKILYYERYALIKNEVPIIKLKNDYNLFQNEVNILFIKIYQNSFPKVNKKFSFLQLLNIFDYHKGIKTLQKNIIFKFSKKKNIFNNLIYDGNNSCKISKISDKYSNENIFKSFTKYIENLEKNPNKICIILKFYKHFITINWCKQTFLFKKLIELIILKKNEIINNINKIETKSFWTLLPFIKNNLEINVNKNTNLESYKNYNERSKISVLNEQYSIQLLETTWISLFETIYNNVKIHKVLLLLKKKWFYILEILKNIYYKDNEQLKLEKLLLRKDQIENKLKNIDLDNLRILHLKFIITIQFLVTLNKKYYANLKLHEDKLLLNINLKKKIVNINKQVDHFYFLLKSFQTKSFICNNLSTIIVEKKYENNMNCNISVEHYVKEVHEHYELKLQKMKEKMKSFCNSQITMMKTKQEEKVKTQMEALESKIKYKCHKHAEELTKYKNHIGELTKQLWNVGDKLINEKQEKEDMIKKLENLKISYKNNEIRNIRHINDKLDDYNYSVIKLEADKNDLKTVENRSNNRTCPLKGFQIMGNAFSNEDEEGEIFDTTYLSDMQKSELNTGVSDRLSVLQMRNAKCKPHLKSSYSAELQFQPVSFTEEEIKTGGTSEELFNDSLSQSLLTGKKVKWKDRARNISDTPRNRRFSNIFRKSR